MQETRQPRGVCHASCRCKAPRLNRCLAARRPLRLPGRLFGAFRHYSAGRGQAAAAPLFAPHGTGAGRPYPMDPTLGRAQPILTRRQTHCSRRSRLKFFAELFFKKAGRSRLKFFAGLFFKKAGAQPAKVFCQAFFQKSLDWSRRSKPSRRVRTTAQRRSQSPGRLPSIFSGISGSCSDRRSSTQP